MATDLVGFWTPLDAIEELGEDVATEGAQAARPADVIPEGPPLWVVDSPLVIWANGGEPARWVGRRLGPAGQAPCWERPVVHVAPAGTNRCIWAPVRAAKGPARRVARDPSLLPALYADLSAAVADIETRTSVRVSYDDCVSLASWLAYNLPPLWNLQFDESFGVVPEIGDMTANITIWRVTYEQILGPVTDAVDAGKRHAAKAREALLRRGGRITKRRRSSSEVRALFPPGLLPKAWGILS